MKKGLILLLTVLLCLGFLACNKTVEFDINFIVDGNVYATINTSGNETISIPQNPIKEGYTFDGWYWDEGKWEKPFTANSLLDAPLSSDMNVYAKWTKIDDALEHTHVVVIDEAIAPTCTTDGFTEGKHCSKCNEVIVAQTRVDALGHTEAEAVVENNVAPDCITDGSYDSVVYCSVCSDEISRTSVTVDALGHSEETITGKAASCTETGLTDGVKCNTCGETLIEQSEIPAKGHTDLEPKDYICDVCNADLCTNHTEETIPAKSPTCTETGLTEGKKCSVCGDIIVAQEIVDALGHTEVTDKAVDATCTATGLTEGKHCLICNETLVVQTVVGALGHTESEAFIENNLDPTCNINGSYDSVVYCSICGDELSRKTITVDALNHNYANYVSNGDATCSTDGTKTAICDNGCGTTDTVIDAGSALGHSYKPVITSPTCTKQGCTTYTCAKCSDSYVGDYTNALGHNYVNGQCTRCGETQIGTTDTYVRCDEDGTPNPDGDYILFGEYPQTIKADNVTITSTQDSRGYYLGSDDYYYAKIVADPISSSYMFSTGDTITEGEIYYFKVEPIRWRILFTDGETAFILCDSIISGMAYDIGKNNNYADSDIRAWLNNEFYNTAFSELHQEIILTTTVDNSAYSTGYDSNSNACEDTEDKIFLLSYSEATNSEYGFSSDLSIGDTTRCMQTSDYSRATNVFMNRYDGSDYGTGRWWLRSPYNLFTENARYINEQGSYNFTGTDGYAIGVVPALWITLYP